MVLQNGGGDSDNSGQKLKAVALSWVDCVPRTTSGNDRRCCFSDHKEGREMLLASSGWRPGMPLSIVHCAGQPSHPSAQNDPAPDDNRARTENSRLKKCGPGNLGI